MLWEELGPVAPKSFDPLRPAEVRLLKGLRGEEGGAPIVGGLVRISAKTADAVGEAESIRADLIRHLLLSPDSRVPPMNSGLRIASARIDGVLDLEGAKLTSDLVLVCCAFDAAPVLRGARCRTLYFDGSLMPGLQADSVRCDGNLFLREGFEATGEVNLLGAEINGSLECIGATLKGGGRFALNAGRVRVTGSILLRDEFKATGEVRLLGAEIGGNLDCTGATLDGGMGDAICADRIRVVGGVFLRDGFWSSGCVRLSTAEIGGALDCSGGMLEGVDGYALRLDNGQVTRGVFLRDGFIAMGALDFTEAQVRFFADEEAGEPAPDLAPLRLSGCTYGKIYCEPTAFTPEVRLRWLDRCSSSHPGAEFHPGPFEQLAKVFRESGRGADARAILIEKERRERMSHRMRLRGDHRILLPALLWFCDGLLATLAYGLRPLQAGYWLLGLWALGAALFFAASHHDAIKPNQPLAMRSPEWIACAAPLGAKVHLRAPNPDGSTTLNGRAVRNQSQRDCFEAQPEAVSWPEFNALVYSADTLLPVVNLEVQPYWIPDEDKGWIGPLARVYLWLHIAAGWALSLLAVAGFSGIVKSD